MAGVTAYFTTQPDRHAVAEILKQTVASAFALPGSKPIVIQLTDRAIALGGNFPRHFQRKANHAATPRMTVLFYGELYNSLGEKEEAQFALDLITKGTLDGLKDLDGPCSLLCWDNHEKTLIVSSDRLGRFPLFYFVRDGLIGVTSDLNAVFSAGVIPAALDLESVVEFLTIGFPMGEKSLFEGIERIAGGTIVTISSAGIKRRRYWHPQFANGPDRLEQMMTTYEACTQRTVDRFSHTAVALTGGWDTRATWAVLGECRERIPAMTFGVKVSSEIEVASAIARRLHLDHLVIEPDHDFLDSFEKLAEKVIMLGNGHVTVDLAFQLYAFDRVAERYQRVLDSAGCEYRRGRRARMTAATAKSANDVASFLLSAHATGIWNPQCVSEALFHGHHQATRKNLAGWLEDVVSDHPSSATERYAEQIDAFCSRELWGHSYAHGYHFQTNVVACSMPNCDNEMYDLYLA